MEGIYSNPKRSWWGITSSTVLLIVKKIQTEENTLQKSERANSPWNPSDHELVDRGSDLPQQQVDHQKHGQDPRIKSEEFQLSSHSHLQR